MQLIREYFRSTHQRNLNLPTCLPSDRFLLISLPPLLPPPLLLLPPALHFLLLLRLLLSLEFPVYVLHHPIHELFYRPSSPSLPFHPSFHYFPLSRVAY